MLEEYKDIQPIAYRVLSNDVSKNQISHAYIFETNGYDEGLDMAISFAKTILCPNKYLNNKKCNNCEQCHTIDEKNFLELKIIEPDGMWIKKDQLLDLQDEFAKKSILGNQKVYIINNAEKLNDSSSNTILKFVEEPPAGIIAILVVDNVYHLIDTIISRCQIIGLNSRVDIKDNDKTVNRIMRTFANSVEKYNSMDETVIQSNIDAVIKFIRYMEDYGNKVLLYIREYWFIYFDDKQLVSDALQIMISFYKDCLNYKVGCEIELFVDNMEDIEYVSNKNKIPEIARKLKIINDRRYDLNNNANIYLLMDKLIVEIEGELE